MGPPDKREPKVSKSAFERPSPNINSQHNNINKVETMIIKSDRTTVVEEKQHADIKTTTPKTDLFQNKNTGSTRNISASYENGMSPLVFRKVIFQKQNVIHMIDISEIIHLL